MFLIYKSIKVRFHCTILPLCLTIYLKIKDGKELSLNTKKVKKRKPKLGGENHLKFTDDKVKKTMILYYYVNIYLYKALSINGDFNRLLVYHFG